MQRRNMQGTFFLHIPRCAGTSVWMALRDIYGFRGVIQVATPVQGDKFEVMRRKKLVAFGAVGGHGPMHLYRETMGEDLASRYKITAFRDPVQRLVSAYHYVRNSPNHHQHSTVCRLSLIEFAALEGSNLQTRHLIGNRMKSRFDVDAALEALEEFDDWCVIGDINRLICRLYEHHGLPAKPALRANIGTKAGRVFEVDTNSLDFIMEHNAVDVEFYGRLLLRKSKSLSSRGRVPWRKHFDHLF